MDEVFKALADTSRRRLLDSLNAQNGQSLRDLCAGLSMTRQSVSKHLAVLAAANLVTTSWRGREKLHFLNAVPINAIADRWIGRYDRRRTQALAELRTALEQEPMNNTEFVYTTYIDTTAERLWQALTDPAFTRRYWGAELRSDWKVGSPVLWKEHGEEDFRDLDQVVLESDRPRRLSYSWHNYQPEHAELFGWSDEELAELRKEKRSKVTFDLEPAGEAVRLTVTHDDFEPDSQMFQAVSVGWVQILAGLKTLLETGDALSLSS